MAGFDNSVKQVNNSLDIKNDMYYKNIRDMQKNSAIRFLDMQSVVSGNLASQQQSVNNAENYPSTWTTNPDGGANGQV